MKSLLSKCILSAIQKDPDIAEYYNRKIAEGKSYAIVSNAIKNKIVQRACAVVKRKIPYVKLKTFA